jgi:hypothetical protein
MKTLMYTSTRWLALMLVAATFCAVCAGEEQPTGTSNDGTGQAEARSGTDAAPTRAAKNPFAYGTAEDERGLVPADTGRLPHGIRLAAVLIPREGEAVAVLRLPGEDTPVFVRENDLISIDPGADERKGGTAAARGGTTAAPFYLLVKSITSTGVEVAPRVRPTEVHLIR